MSYFVILIHLCIFCIVFLSNFYIVGNNSDAILNYLSTRTPYRYKYNKNESAFKFPGCKATKVWMLVRHGTRLPSAADIRGIETDLTLIRNQILQMSKLGMGSLNPQQLQQFKDWSLKLDPIKQKHLTLEGRDEMIFLAERMHRRFPLLIKDKYDNQTFLFRYTATERAQQSAKYFTIGLFDQKHSKDVRFSPAAEFDPVLRFYKHCDRWQKLVKKNLSTYEEQKLYGNSKEMNKSLEVISKRLGLDKVISLDKATLMYKLCGYETAWDKHHESPWCHVFDVASAKNFEFYHDLKHYWMDGYGHKLTSQLACLPIKTMFENFSTEHGPFATFLFAHSGTLLKLLSHLELYKPATHLKANSRQRDRTWKATDIDCFASNLAFILYRCNEEDYVLSLHQERIVKLPMCKNDLCSLKFLRSYFHDSIHKCNFTEMCSLREEDL